MNRAVKITTGITRCCPLCHGPLPACDFEVDLNYNAIRVGDKMARVPGKIAELVYTLRRAYPALVPRETVFACVWGADAAMGKTLDTTVCHARRYLEHFGWTITTEYGLGIRLEKIK